MHSVVIQRSKYQIRSAVDCRKQDIPYDLESCTSFLQAKKVRVSRRECKAPVVKFDRGTSDTIRADNQDV